MTRNLFLLLLSFITVRATAQNIPINQWRSHLPYNDGFQVVEVGHKIYCATKTGLFYWDKSDNSVHALSKVDGFSDVFVKTMTYDAPHDILFIAYQNGNLDILQHGRIYNVPDFQNNNVIINSIYTNGDIAYICGTSSDPQLSVFELRMNTSDRELGDRYNTVSPKGVYRVTVLGNYLYACADSGVRRVPLNTLFKSDPGNWQHISTDSCSGIVTFAGKVFGTFTGGVLKYYDEAANNWVILHHTKGNPFKSLESNNGKMALVTQDSIFIYSPDLSLTVYTGPQQNDAIVDKDQDIWVAINTYAMHDLIGAGAGFKFPTGRPQTINGFTAYSYKNQVWISTGLFQNNGAPGYDFEGFYMFDGDNWHIYNSNTMGFNMPGDIMGMAIDSVSGHLWLASLDSGVLEFDPKTEKILNIYNRGNTADALPTTGDKYKGITPAASVSFDQDDNLWVGCYRTSNGNQLAIRSHATGAWSAFTRGSQTQVNKVLCDDYGDTWMLAARDKSGVVVYNKKMNKTAVLTSSVGAGGLPADNVNCITKDKSGQIWMGTTAGVCVYSDPTLLFGKQEFDVQRPYVSNGPNQGYLLAAQNITCIAIDGANRKWIGTSTGAYLTNDAGDQVIEQFTTANSPLVSNQINAIGINGVTGEVFFITDKGIVSLRYNATEGGMHNENVYAFPNPVKPDYHGPIAIRGLVADANVKITDITGQLVFETTALGGQAIWNGKNFSGREANSGVYLVFVTNTDGTETIITKILIVR